MTFRAKCQRCFNENVLLQVIGTGKDESGGHIDIYLRVRRSQGQRSSLRRLDEKSRAQGPTDHGLESSSVRQYTVLSGSFTAWDR